MTREEVQPAWERIVDLGYSDYAQLTREERVWFNVEPLTTGGLIDHYVNHGAGRNQDAIDDLEYLGASNVADLLRRVNGLFKSGKPPADVDERNEEIVSWSERTSVLFEEMEAEFWSHSERLDKALLDHITATGIGLVKYP